MLNTIKKWYYLKRLKNTVLLDNNVLRIDKSIVGDKFGDFNKYLFNEQEMILELKNIYNRFKLYKKFHKDKNVAILAAFMNDRFLDKYIKDVLKVIYTMNKVDSKNKNYVIKNNFVYIFYMGQLSVWKIDIAKNSMKSLKSNFVNLDNIIKDKRDLYILDSNWYKYQYVYDNISELFESLYCILTDIQEEPEIIDIKRREK